MSSEDDDEDDRYNLNTGVSLGDELTCNTCGNGDSITHDEDGEWFCNYCGHTIDDDGECITEDCYTCDDTGRSTS